MINLLPPSYKEELKGEARFRLVLVLGLLLGAFFVCLSLLLLSIRVYTAAEIQAQKILVESQREEGGELRLQQIRELNEKFRRVDSFYARGVLLSNIIEQISGAFPAGAYLTSFRYTATPQSTKIALVGFAPQTEDLLSLRTNLEQNPLFTNFHFPSSNWILPTNIDFSFDFEL